VIASGCPPIAKITRDLGPFTLVGMSPPAEEVADIYAPRRTVLDTILVDAARAAGAELCAGFLDLAPHFAERVRHGRREERFVGTAEQLCSFRAVATRV